MKHITHGMMRFASGKMGSRKGNVVTGESLIESAREAISQKMKDRDLLKEEKEKGQVLIFCSKRSTVELLHKNLRLQLIKADMVKKGVKIKIILPENSDKIFMDLIRNNYLGRLYRNGVKIYFYPKNK